MHRDQLSLNFRYLEGYEPVERFVTFLPNVGHKGSDMFDALASFLEEHGILMKDCRFQTYDNASNMSGKFNGLQALVKKKNRLAKWIPCFAHSVNLVDTNAMNCSLESKKFFCFIENMYVFFISSPTERYDLLMKILKENLPEGINRVLVPKRVDTNRWLSRGDAVESVYQGFDGYRIALSELSSSYDEAASLLGSMNKLETGVLLVFWNDILDRVNSTSLRLQSYNSDLNSSIILLISLCDYIESLRSRFEFYENRGKELVGSDEYDFTKKRRKEPNVRLIPLGEDQVPRVNLNGSEKFKNDFYMPIIDSLTKSLGQRIAAYKEVEAIFGFMRKLLDLTPEEIEVHARNVLEEYGDDLEEGLINELIQFKPFVGAFLEKEEEENICFEAKALKILMKTDTQAVFPNVTILLRTYLVLMTTNCTSERSFSKLKLIESRLRSMGENRLNNLTRMSAESDLMREMSFDDLIEEFANRKSRRVFI
ncbi:hypothetical protein QAD02_021488 [Eretmocerus hayati]|uniref:Uncharacterized protein n=1 Tax=Eretmocerus hayati TaxID=131215 RepID=A0ACC2PV76_9HYME|nr:hypothetical protein QAD02_021488 [Eretmocerus hayati]